jgi:hypothetical protein
VRRVSGDKKAPSQKRCCPKAELHIPSFPRMGGTGISICAFEAFQPTVCLPWILFRQDSSERASIESRILYQGPDSWANPVYSYGCRDDRQPDQTIMFLWISFPLAPPLWELQPLPLPPLPPRRLLPLLPSLLPFPQVAG